MAVLLGIDTGGTYTDAVLLDEEQGVLGKAKALTTKYDLSVGIQNAVLALPHPLPDIQLVSLSSTLATNAIVEGKGSTICLLLIGYDPRIIAATGFERLVSKDNIVFIQGGHTVTGEEQSSLDIDAAKQAILTHASDVTVFAVSGYFSVRNPEHELQVKKLVHDLTGLPVTCGHELTTHLHAPLRALTTALNARLIPLLQQLIFEVREVLTSQDIKAPLMVVKGDASLVDEKTALERPVETILSGPAASAIGASHLARAADVFVIDMGGTTTDIAALHEGHPVLNVEGAKVGEWQTMVGAVDVQTTGLGGDSEVHLDESGHLCVGPRRVVPLSLLAMQWPAAIDTLRELSKKQLDWDMGRFVMRERPLGNEESSLTLTQREIWELLADGPVDIVGLGSSVKSTHFVTSSLADLMERGLIVISAFTPTDAVHVLRQYCEGSTEAAELGAEMWARRLNISKEDFSEQVIRQVIVQAGFALMNSALAEESVLSLGEQDRVGNLLIKKALGAESEKTFAVTFSLRHAIVGIGAPAATYLSPLAEKLHARLRIPEHAEVANAIGAVAGRVVQTVSVLVRPLTGDGIFRAYLPGGVRDFSDLKDAVTYAEDAATSVARERAHRAGAKVVRVHTEHHDRIVRTASGFDMYLETEVVATAVGRPLMKE